MSDLENKNQLSTGLVPDREFASAISIETLVKLLVSKGLLSVHELLEEEKKTRASTLQQEPPDPEHAGSSKNRGLRRLAAKHRWSRHITSLFFGWQWKKIKSGATPSKPDEQ
jgi:hypothetical protein